MEIDYTKTIVGIVGKRCKEAIEVGRSEGNFPESIQWPTAIEIAQGPLTVDNIEPILTSFITEWKRGYSRQQSANEPVWNGHAHRFGG